MTPHTLHVLTIWIRVVLIISAICTTSVPVMYAFFPWRSRPVGRILMAKGISFAAAMDLSALFSVWKPQSIFFLFLVDAIVLTMIAISTLCMSLYMGKIIFLWRKAAKR